MDTAKIGVAIVTYNRCSQLQDTIRAVKKFTPEDHLLLISDDGSTDQTVEVCRKEQVKFISGRNRGISWNKNRALFQLLAVAGCDVAILLEDDTCPTDFEWTKGWIESTLRWGHANYCPSGSDSVVLGSSSLILGTGSVDDPHRSTSVTAQCSSFSREAMRYVGYFDSRLNRYGHEHVEHSLRMIRAGYGGEIKPEVGAMFFLVRSPLAIQEVVSWGSPEAVEHNLRIIDEIRHDPIYRHPWRTDADMREFRDEQRQDSGYKDIFGQTPLEGY